MNVNLTTRVYESQNKHVPILVYEGRDIVNVKRIFNRIAERYPLGETWFFSHGDDYCTISFHVFDWLDFRGMICTAGISKRYKYECISNKCGSLSGREAVKLLWKVNESPKDMELKMRFSPMIK